jgi:hypothetical protein
VSKYACFRSAFIGVHAAVINCATFWPYEAFAEADALAVPDDRGFDHRAVCTARTAIFRADSMKRLPLDDSFKVNRNPVTLREIVLDKLRSAIMNFQLHAR